MTVARSVADVLSTHVRFEVECIDRMYLNLYQPKLQYAAGLVGYVHRQLGLPIASTAPLARITDRFVAAVHRFADTKGDRRMCPRWSIQLSESTVEHDRVAGCSAAASAAVAFATTWSTWARMSSAPTR